MLDPLEPLWVAFSFRISLGRQFRLAFLHFQNWPIVFVASSNHFRKMQLANTVKVFVFDGGLLTHERLICFVGDNVFHHVLPNPRGQLGIGGVQINPPSPKLMPAGALFRSWR
jgi:hypothetical protein